MENVCNLTNFFSRFALLAAEKRIAYKNTLQPNEIDHINDNEKHTEITAKHRSFRCEWEAKKNGNSDISLKSIISGVNRENISSNYRYLEFLKRRRLKKIKQLLKKHTRWASGWHNQLNPKWRWIKLKIYVRTNFINDYSKRIFTAERKRWAPAERQCQAEEGGKRKLFLIICHENWICWICIDFRNS